MPHADCVFVLDDDPSARRGLTRLLRAAGHDFRDFGSSQEFLDALGSEAFGCLVLDAGMPGLSIEELQAELEARGARLPIIVVTADDDPETKRKAEKIKAVGFFRKPVDGVALLDAVEWALRREGAGGDPEKA
jgi:FixJ family two-component response regulator